MKPSTSLIALACLSVACAQGGAPAAPPQTTASPAAAVSEPTVPPPATTVAPAVEPPSAAPARTAPVVVAPPAREAMAKPEPETTKAPVRIRILVPKGTRLPIEIQTPVSTATSRDGDPVIAVLTEDVPLQGFKLDKGAEVRGRVVTAVAAKRTKGQAHLVVSFDAVMESGEKVVIMTEPIDSMAKSTKSKDTKIIAGAAAGGLIIGAIKDGGKGAAIGTLIGAAAGTGTVLIMKGDEVEMPRGATLILTVIE